MKQTKPLEVGAPDRARAILAEWFKTGMTDETAAGLIGCVVQSVKNWRANGRISRLAASAIIAAEAKRRKT